MKNQQKSFHKYLFLLVCVFALFLNTAYSSSDHEYDPLDQEIRQLIDRGIDLIPVNTNAAKQYILLAREKAENNNKQALLRDSYLAASKCYAYEQKYDSAVYYRELFVEVHYQLYLDSREKLIDHYSQLYSDSVDYFKRELLQTDADIKHTRAQISRVAFVGIIAAVIIIAIIVGYLAKQRKAKKKTYNKLKQYRSVINQQREEILLQYEHLNMLNEEIKAQNSLVESHRSAVTKKNNQLLEIYKNNDKQNKILTQNLIFAKQIQSSLLPASATLEQAFNDFFILYKPSEYVGGDFYWFHQTPQYTFIILADCTGHGVPGAFISVLGKTLLDKIIMEQKLYDPAEILLQLHKETTEALATGKEGKCYEELLDDGMDIAICRFSKNFDKLTFAGARRPVVLILNNEIKEIKGEKFSIGSYTRQSRWKKDILFTNHHVDIKDNCLCYLFSDGYSNQMSQKNGKIGAKRFRELIRENYSKPFNEQKAVFEGFFDEHKKDQDQTDDMSVVGVKVSRTKN